MSSTLRSVNHQTERVAPNPERSKVATHRFRESLTINDLAKLLGKSRAQTYRDLPRLIADGTLIKVTQREMETG